jgi:hypothetical protein
MVCFQTKNSQFLLNLEGLGIKNVVIFYDLLEYFAAISYNLQPLGIVCSHLEIFFRFGNDWTKKSGNPYGFHQKVPFRTIRSSKHRGQRTKAAQ